MIKVTVDLHKEGEKPFKITYRAGSGYYMHDKIFDFLYRNGIKEELAIDAASWCELAEDGMSYMEEDFDLYVEPDTPSVTGGDYSPS